MLYFDRNGEPAPACLSDERTQRARDALRDAFSGDIDHVSQLRFSMEGFLVQDHELQAALERLFRGRCAFCERAAQTRPYRFRPTEEAGPTSAAAADAGDRAHLYYTWLANSWDNIYPLCNGCQPREPSVFPVRGRRCPLPERREIESYAVRAIGTWRIRPVENPMALDPCTDLDFRDRLLVLPDGRMFGIDDRGRFTVAHFNLDRPEARSSRSKALGGYFQSLLAGKSTSELFAFETLAHGGAWYLLLYRLARKLGRDTGAHPKLTREHIGSFFAKRIKDPAFREEIELARDDLLANYASLLDPDRTARVQASNSAPRPVKIEIQNFKSIEKLELELADSAGWRVKPDEPAGGAVMILGENATGKSSVLEAIALALSPNAAINDLSPEAGRFMLSPKMMGGTGAKRRGRVVVDFEEGPQETLLVQPGWPRPGAPPGDRERLPVFAYGAFRMFLQGQGQRRASANVRSLFEPGHLLPNPAKWLAELHGTPAFAEVVRALRSILAIDQAFDVVEPDEEGAMCLTIATELANGETARIHTPLDSVSSGFRSVLAMACDILKGLLSVQGTRSATLARARALVLIDEVEAHLHPRWKMRIMTGLRQSLPNVTFVVSTHDPLCLRGMAAHEVMVLRRSRRAAPTADQCAEFVERLDDIPPIDRLTVEQLLTSDLFQLFSTDADSIEDSLAQTGDLLALEQAERLGDADTTRLNQLRAKLQNQIVRAIPVGSTQVERLIQDAVETYLIKRRATLAQDMARLRDDTKRAIVAALDRL